MPGIIPIKTEEVHRLAYGAAWQTLQNNWNGGVIDRSDLRSYLKVIDDKNAPFTNTVVETDVRQAIADFLTYVDRNRIPDNKTGAISLSGFLSSVWSGVKSVVGGVVNTVTGGGSKTVKVEVQPAAGDSSVSVQTPTTTYSSGAQPQPYYPATQEKSWYDNPALLIGLGVGAIVLLQVVKK